MKRKLKAAALIVSLSAVGGAVRLARGADAANNAEAQRKFEAGDYQGTLNALRPVMAGNSTDPAALFWLGRTYYELRDFDSAVTYAEKAVALAPKNSLYHQWLGRIYGGKADRDRSFFLAKKVKAEFQEAVKLDPSNIEARRDLEEYCLSAPWIVGGNKDEAQAQVDAIAAIDPVEGHIARGMYTSQALKKNADAEAEYRAALNAKPKRIEPYFEVANYFANQNKAADLDAAIDGAAAISPNDARLGYYRGVAAVLSGGEAASAEQYLKSYIASTPMRSSWPEHAAAREWLGKLYERQGKSAQAIEQYRAALQLDSNRKDAKEHLKKLEKDSQ